MPMRLIEACFEGKDPEWMAELAETVGEESLHVFRSETQNLLRILVDSKDSQQVIDLLEQRLKDYKGFRLVILPVEGTVPPFEETTQGEGKNQEEEQASPWKQPFRKGTQLSREELYADISDTVSLSRVQLVLVILSAIVAAIGLVRDNAIVLVGAMVLAPLLGPNVATSFSICLGDFSLLGKSLKANFLRIGVALLFSFLLGLFLNPQPMGEQILARTQVHYSDVILALVSGIAAALSFTTAISSGFIGVMVAVALLPPLATSGILLASGLFVEGLGAFLLFLVNMVSVNLASMLTFAFQGVSPRRWWEAEKAKKALKRALWLWMVLLGVLVTAVLLMFPF
ncbi:MAG TPA: TIGR00341 family protein [Thermotogota bacterium]|nr:TIGR00341 family protein [Thermotogota bacterium]